MSKNQAISPFKFLDSYAKEDKDIFFGRNQEISEIHAKIYQSKLLLVYGASGTGKSSIINCGLANRLDDTDWLPVQVRRGGNISSSMMRQLQKHTASDLDLAEEKSEKDFHANLHKIVSNVFLDHFKPIYLVFDQFEELFIFGYKEEWIRFIRAVRYLMDTDLDVHFVFIIRGEYLEFLSEFEEIIPEFFDNRVRIEKMTRAMARESITGPSELFSISLDKNFEENLLKKLSPDKTQIELTFLQVILDKIYQSAKARTDENEAISFTNEDIEQVGQIGDILAEFVDEQLFKMPDSKAALTVLKGFVSLEGTKTQRNLEEIASHCENIGHPLDKDKVEEIITSFVNKRILKEKDDNDRYELRHDSLAQKIFEKITNQEKELLEVRRFITYNFDEFQKRQSILNDEDLSYIAPYERLLKLEPEQREFIELSKKKSSKRKKAQRTRSIIIAIISLLMVTSIIGFVVSQQQRKRAENLALVAADESEKAKTAQEIAEQQSLLAVTNAEEARIQALIADQQAANALAARDQARLQQNEALRQRALADAERLRAEQARTEAISNEQEAIAQRAEAESRRLEAEKLRMLALSRELALKSIYLVDQERKALLSKVAYDLNNDFEGDQFAPNIYRSLYLSNKTLHGDDFNSIAFNNKEIIGLAQLEGRQLVATSDGDIFELIWSKGEARSANFLNTDLRISSFSYEGGNEIIIGERNGDARVINTSGRLLYEVKTGQNSPVVKVLSLSAQVKVMALNNGQVNLVNREGEIIRTINLDTRINDLTPLPTGEIAVATETAGLVILDKELNVEIEIPLKNEVGLSSLIPLESSNELLISNKNGEIFRYDLAGNEINGNLIGHTAGITDMQVSPNGNYLITSSFDRSVRLWNLKNYRSQSILLSNHDRWATAVGFDGKAPYAYSTSYGGKVRKYPLNTSELEEGLCQLVGRSLTKDEWSEFIGNELSYKEICQ